MNNLILTAFMNSKIFYLTISQILSYFIIFSFLGWFFESIFNLINTKQLVNKGVLCGPYCVMYGFNFCFIALVLPNEFINIITIFIIFVVTASFEYISALIIEIFYDFKYWDYSHSKYNFKGYISLSSVLSKSLIFIFSLYLMDMFAFSTLNALPDIFSHVFIILYLLIILADFVFIFTQTKNLNKKLQSMFRINRKLREFIETTALLETADELFDYAEMNFEVFYQQTNKLILKRGTNHPVYSSSEVLERSKEMYDEYNHIKLSLISTVKRIEKNFPDISSLIYQKELLELIKFNKTNLN